MKAFRRNYAPRAFSRRRRPYTRRRSVGHRVIPVVYGMLFHSALRQRPDRCCAAGRKVRYTLSIEPSSASCASTEISGESMDMSTLPDRLPSANPEPSLFHITGARKRLHRHIERKVHEEQDERSHGKRRERQQHRAVRHQEQGYGRDYSPNI